MGLFNDILQALFSNDPKEHYDRAMQYQAAGDLENTISELNECIRLDNSQAEAHNSLSWLLSTLSLDIDRAIYHAQQAVRLDPQSGMYLDTLAEAYFWKGDYGSAFETCMKAFSTTKEENTQFSLLLRLGRIYQAQNRHVEAIQAFRHAEAINHPTPPYDLADVHFGMAFSYAQLQDHIEAVEYYQKVLELRPEDPFTKNHLACSLLALTPSQTTQAEKYLLEALMKASEMKLTDLIGSIYFNLACASGIAKDCTSAVKWIQQGIQYFDPTTIELVKDDPDLEDCRLPLLKILRDYAKITENEYQRMKRTYASTITRSSRNEKSMRNHTRAQVFISYSHEDEVWRDKLVEMLTPAMKRIKVRDDKEIKPGAKWQEEIGNALASANVAVLLVSPSFLASEFIGQHELPHLLKAAEKKGLTILWVPVRRSFYTQTEIADYKAATDPERPLDLLPPAELSQVLLEICKQIVEAAEKSR